MERINVAETSKRAYRQAQEEGLTSRYFDFAVWAIGRSPRPIDTRTIAELATEFYGGRRYPSSFTQPIKVLKDSGIVQVGESVNRLTNKPAQVFSLSAWYVEELESRELSIMGDGPQRYPVMSNRDEQNDTFADGPEVMLLKRHRHRLLESTLEDGIYTIRLVA